MRSSKKIIKATIVFLFVFCTTIVFFEVFLRTTEIMLPSYVYDNSELGRTHKPSALVSLVGAEGFYMGSINKFGYAGKSYDKEKSKNVFRIALIGDSYIEGFQIFARDNFGTYLEQKLNKTINKKIEVLNFGIGGVDLRGMYLRFEKLAKDYNPDMTLFFIKEEDLVKKDVLPTPNPFIINNSIGFNDDYLNTSDSKLRQRFAFVRAYSVGNLLKEVFEVYHNGSLLNILLDKFSAQSNSPNKHLKEVYSINSDRFYLINKIILENLLTANNVMYHPTIVQVDDYPNYYNELLKRAKFNIIPLNEELKKYDNLDLTYWKASGKVGHWNHFAQSVIGEYLVKEIYSSVSK